MPTRVKLAGEPVLLTGASAGIGRALALALGARGARLAISARREALLEEVAGEIERAGGVRPVVLPADLSQRGAAAELAERATAALGHVHVLVNNAGVGVGGSQWTLGDRDEGREVYEVNVWSPLALVSALVPAMRERRSGAVVNVTSMAQVVTLGLLGHYTSSKAAIANATEALRMELHGSGVHVMEVIPGPTATAIEAEMSLIPGADKAMKGAPVGEPADLARLAVRGLERGRSRVLFPRPIVVPYNLPFLARLNARRLARMIDGGDTRLVRAGSMGDEEVVEARARWERERAGAR